jgi:hypothetical protein
MQDSGMSCGWCSGHDCQRASGVEFTGAVRESRAESLATQLSLAVDLPAEANCNFQRSDIVWKNPIALGQGSSAIVFEAIVREANAPDLKVVIKERRERVERNLDLKVHYLPFLARPIILECISVALCTFLMLQSTARQMCRAAWACMLHGRGEKVP